MTNEIVKIDAKQYGLEEQKAAQIEAQFKPMLEKMVELEKEFNEVLQLPIEEIETATKAKELRLKYVKVRTGTAAIHEQQKAFYLAGGRFVDGWKNAQLFASQGIENKLIEIEKHQENLEKQRIAAIEAERTALIQPYTEIMPLGLGTMQQEVFDNYLNGLRVAYEARIEAERKAEADRIAREKAEEEARQQMIIENARLKKEAKERERLAKIEAEKRAKEDAARLAKEKKEREAFEAKLKEQVEAREKIEREERAAREKLEKELQVKILADNARIAAEKKAAAEKLEAERKAAAAPEKEKVIAWINSMEVKACEVNSLHAKAAVNVIQQKFDAFKNWAISQTENL